MTNCGGNNNHEDRMAKNITDKGEQSCHMELLLKDHKGWVESSGKPPPSRPVVSGNTGLNCHLSELLSNVLEPITKEAPGSEIDSTKELLDKINKLNEKLSKVPNSSSKCPATDDSNVDESAKLSNVEKDVHVKNIKQM